MNYFVKDVERLFVILFFSSRRRHTRFKCHWSSDVCSSDLKSQRRPDCIRTGTKYVGIRPEGISAVRNRVAEYVGLPQNDVRTLPVLSRECVVYQHAIDRKSVV